MTEFNISDFKCCLKYFEEKIFTRENGHIYRYWIDELDTNLWERNGSIGTLKKTKRYLKEKEELDKKKMESSKEEEDGYTTPDNDDELNEKYNKPKNKGTGAGGANTNKNGKKL